jgi:hypothetical protein
MATLKWLSRSALIREFWAEPGQKLSRGWVSPLSPVSVCICWEKSHQPAVGQFGGYALMGQGVDSTGRGGGIRRLASLIHHASESIGHQWQLAETKRFPLSLWLPLLSTDSFLRNQFPQKTVSMVSHVFCVRTASAR